MGIRSMCRRLAPTGFLLALALCAGAVTAGTPAPAQSPLPVTNAQAWEAWGSAVAVDGDTAVVASSYADVGAVDGAGVANVYVRANGVWTLQARLSAADPKPFSNYARALAIAGDTIVVGAASADGAVSSSGAVYVYTRSGTTWTQSAKLSASDGEGFSDFGLAVALAGDRIAVGAPSTFVGKENVQGAVYVYAKNGAAWSQEAKLIASDGAAFHNLGRAVAIDGDTIVAGAQQASGNGMPFAGAAYVFVRGGGTWTEQAKLAAADAGFGDEFGYALAFAGDTALVGARAADVDGAVDQGAAYAFVRSGATWTQTAKLVATGGEAGDAFGTSVALSGDNAAIGAPGAGSINGVDLDRGAVFAFSRSGAWSPSTRISAFDAAQGDAFGASVALDGTLAIAGSPRATVGKDMELGKAYALSLGVAQLAVSASAFDFGDVATGTASAARTLTVSNVGTADLFSGQLVLIDADAASFAIANDTCSGQRLESGAHCSADVTFHPADVRAHAARLVAPGSAGVAFVALTGNGVPPPPQIAVEPGSIDASLPQGGTTSRPLTIRHSGASGTLQWQLTEAPAQGGVRRVLGATKTAVAAGPASNVDIARFVRSNGHGARRVPVARGVSPVAHTLTHSASNDILEGNSIACADNTTGFTNANQYLRTFTLADFGITDALSVTHATFGVENLTVSTPVTVNLYTLSGTSLVYTNLSLIGTATVTLDPQTGTLVDVPITASVAPDATLVVEIAVPDLGDAGGAFFFGTNTDGQTAPSYIAASACGSVDPADLADIGFENMQLVLSVTGTTPGAPVDCARPAWLSASPTSGSVQPGAAQVSTLALNATGLAAGDYTANVCVASNASDPLVVVPVTLNVTANGPNLVAVPALDFGGVATGRRAVRRMTLASSGTVAVNVGAIGTPAAPFAEFGRTCPAAPFALAPGQSCVVEYAFDPVAVGAAETSVTIASDAVTGPATAVLRGVGIGPSDAIFRNGMEIAGD